MTHRTLALLGLLSLLIAFTSCGGATTTGDPGRIRDPAGDLITDRGAEGPDGRTHKLSGKASWYGKNLHGRTTASGELFDMYGFTAAHRTLPFHSVVRVVEPTSQKSVVVRVTDRGPYSKGRVIDLSWAAARDLDMIDQGVVPVEIVVLEWGDGSRR